MLPTADHDRWQRAYGDGDEDFFCTKMSADYIVSILDEFLGYFMVRKVIAGQELLRASGTVTKKLLRWLQDQGVVDLASADHPAEKAAAAGRDLPNAERLADALYELSLGTPIRGRGGAERWIEDGLPLTITKVAPGELWFSDGIGPLLVPRKISQLALATDPRRGGRCDGCGTRRATTESGTGVQGGGCRPGVGSQGTT